jgi:septum formation protein
MAAAGFRFDVEESGFLEPAATGDVDIQRYVVEMAWCKAREVAARLGAGVVLGADTACEVDGLILGKPADRSDAERMIRVQEGRRLAVWTGLCFYDAAGREWIGAAERSEIWFRELTDEARSRYLESRQWEGKAGGYGVQDADPFVEMVTGSWSNVVGLPMERVVEILAERFGIRPME